jgi:hypothetical protein
MRKMGDFTLKTAAGELVLIIVGVFIALAASDWQQKRADRATELDLLQEMSGALGADLAQLDALVERSVGIEARVEVLLAYLRSEAPYHDSIDAYFGTLYGFADPQLNTAGYESLKSQGLELITDDGLRSQIARVYETSYVNSGVGIEMERDVILDLLRPYFLIHFRDLRFGSSATPLDYAAVSTDPEFLNLVDYRLQLVRQNHLPRLRGAIPEIRALKEAIDEELGADG